LVATYVDPRQFVARYNEAAEAENSKNGGNLPLFSAEILKAVGSESVTARKWSRAPPGNIRFLKTLVGMASRELWPVSVARPDPPTADHF
jgi:hypothetical protein